MVRLVLLALFVLASPGLVAQQSDPPTLQATGERPAAVVARMARQAMGLPAAPEGWRALAQALPEMALLGDADLEATFDAARIADSLSLAVTTASGPTTARPAQVTAVLRLLEEHWVNLTLALLGAAAASTLVARLSRRRTPKTTAPQQRGRVCAARSLATQGLSVHEIARRTGVAQDAVHVLMNLAGGVKKPEAPAAKLQLENRLAAHRLKDRRLTYGPGARA